MERHPCHTCFDRNAQWKLLASQTYPIDRYYCSLTCQPIGQVYKKFVANVERTAMEWWEHLVMWAVALRNTLGAEGMAPRVKTARDMLMLSATKWDGLMNGRASSFVPVTETLLEFIEAAMRRQAVSAAARNYTMASQAYFGNQEIWKGFQGRGRKFLERIRSCFSSLTGPKYQVWRTGFQNKDARKALADCQQAVERFAKDFQTFISKKKYSIGAEIRGLTGLTWEHSIVEFTTLLIQRALLGRRSDAEEPLPLYYQAIEAQMMAQGRLWHRWTNGIYPVSKFDNLVTLLKEWAVAITNRNNSRQSHHELLLIRNKGDGMDRFIDPVTKKWNAWLGTIGEYLGRPKLIQKKSKAVFGAAKALARSMNKTNF